MQIISCFSKIRMIGRLLSNWAKYLHISRWLRRLWRKACRVFRRQDGSWACPLYLRRSWFLLCKTAHRKRQCVQQVSSKEEFDQNWILVGLQSYWLNRKSYTCASLDYSLHPTSQGLILIFIFVRSLVALNSSNMSTYLFFLRKMYFWNFAIKK